MSSPIQPSLEEINEKLDRILAHQRAATIWGALKGFVWLGMIVLLVILPLYYAYDFVQNPAQYIDLTQFKDFQNTIQEMMKQVK